MIIKEVIGCLENWAPPALQEDYDNAGLITGDPNRPITGTLCSLDATEDVVQEAIDKNCNLIISHHPIVFRPLKKFSNNSYVERTLIKAIKNDIALYVIHTNLDSVNTGVNYKIAEKIGLDVSSLRILKPKNDQLAKLYVYVPLTHADLVKQALFGAGAGAIGNYNECSFTVEGTGSFKPLPGSNPFIGTSGGDRENVPEVKIEVVLYVHQSSKILSAMRKAHPYETIAYGLQPINNQDEYTGSGMIGRMAQPIAEADLLALLKTEFGVKAIKHTSFCGKPIEKIALCGGSGSFLTQDAIAAGADAYITADIKYHEYFDADSRLLLVDIGHWESEQFTPELIINFLQRKFPTFAVLKSQVNTNPVHQFV